MGRRLAASACGLLLAATFHPETSYAQNADPARIAIVDVSLDTRLFLDGLEAVGVRVIGRYYSRCFQSGGFAHKRFIDNEDGQPEADAILAHRANFGILSVYQYNSSSKSKFGGASTFKVPVDYDYNADSTRPEYNWMRCSDPRRPLTAKEEGALDAKAAVFQAKRVKQPPGSAIYFGIDLDYNATLQRGVLDYFKAVHKILGDAGYEVGAYGNGDSLKLLKGQPQPLIKFAWINASRGHGGNVDEFNLNHWDMLQTTTDTPYQLPTNQSLVLDIDIQNASDPGKYLGFWRRANTPGYPDGKFLVTAERTKAVSAARRFSCAGRARIREAPSEQGTSLTLGCGVPSRGCDPFTDRDGNFVANDDDLRRRVCFGNVTRVLETDPSGKFVRVDCDENGGPDGWMKAEDISPSFAVRPAWVGNRTRRVGLTRRDTLCEPGP